MLTMGPGSDMCFPDVCLTYEGETVSSVSYSNTSETCTTSPAAYNVLVDCMPALNILSVGLISEGDEVGILLGIISHMISGETIYTLGCLTVMADGVPAQRLTSITGQNAMGMLPNGVGVCISPSQETVLALG